MTTPYLFLTLIVTSLENPKSKIDVFRKPLIDELLILWNDNIPSYDISLEQNVQMKVTLVWTINDFPTFGML